MFLSLAGYYHSHFTDGETEALGRLVTCPQQKGSGTEVTAKGHHGRTEVQAVLPGSPEYLVFVGGVEGNFSYFLVPFTHQLHGAGG